MPENWLLLLKMSASDSDSDCVLPARRRISIDRVTYYSTTHGSTSSSSSSSSDR